MGNASAAREKANMYKELEEKLGEKLDEVTSYYSMAREGLEGWHDSLANGPGEAQGKIVTDFINKEAVWKGEYEGILSAMKNTMITLVLRKTEAGQLKTYWEMQAEIEEMKERNANVGF
ncbi:MAG: hypothetical protein HFI48_14225 [Lachnospiraceae bacterium]|nr:hypothetical protein [Lachnospiraceae bacterium]